jgi:transposase
MVQRRISEAQKWQIIGMDTTGMSFKTIGHQMGYHFAVVSRLVRKHTQTNNVKDLPRSGRPRVTSDRDDRALQRFVRRMPFANSPVLKQHWLSTTRTVRNRLKSAGLKSRRVIVGRSTSAITFGMVFSTTWLEFKDMAQNSLVGREPVSASCNRWPDDGLETQKYSPYPKEHPANCPLRWRFRNGLACISHDCKPDLVTIQGNLTGDQYIRDVLQPVVVPHFNNHALATMPLYMDGNAQAPSFKSSNRLPPKHLFLGQS